MPGIILAANWKMNMNLSEGSSFLSKFAGQELPPDVEAVICPPFTLLYPLSQIKEKTPFKLGAQNMHWEEKGAFTGEISPLMLKDLGVEYVILGHSERRALFQEDDGMIARKLASALAHNLRPIFCVGETLEQRENEDTFNVLGAQLRRGLKGVAKEQVSAIVLAYEPVWAIGTGRAARAEDALEAARFIRERFRALYGGAVAAALPILYGGSVKGGNVREFIGNKEINGVLVGGASLDPDQWRTIIEAAR
ncbi:MAG TPA: triose-phosphate isomerase [Firmicutes bacterium]|nr:triose-phosphate isomerase [Bacillota bacterium]